MSNINLKKHLNIYTQTKFDLPEKKSSSCLTTNYSNYNSNKIKKNNKHIIINSNISNINNNINQKRIPNLIKNIHHKPKVAITTDIFRYQPLTSFELKLSKELGRLNKNYTQIKNRKFFNKNDSTSLYWMNFPDYEIYRQLKELDTRKEIPYGFTKPRLKPLIINTKNKLGKLAKNLYEADQVEKFNNLLHKYKINKGTK